MGRKELREDFNKVSNIVSSCKTSDQLAVASKVVERYRNKYSFKNSSAESQLYSNILEIELMIVQIHVSYNLEGLMVNERIHTI